MESYEVLLWYTSEEGFRRQVVVVVRLSSSNKEDHDRAEAEALKEFEGLNPEIVSVKYQ